LKHHLRSFVLGSAAVIAAIVMMAPNVDTAQNAAAPAPAAGVSPRVAAFEFT